MQKLEKARDKLVSLLKESRGNILQLTDAAFRMRGDISGMRISKFVKRFPSSFHVKGNFVKLGPFRLQSEIFIDGNDTLTHFLTDWKTYGSKASYLAIGCKYADDSEEEKLSVIQIAWPFGGNDVLVEESFSVRTNCDVRD